MLPGYVKVAAADGDLRRVQDNVADCARRIIACPLLDGRLVPGVVLSSTVPTPINHSLQRAPLGWIIVDCAAAAKVYRVASQVPTQLLLRADTAVTVSVWVF